MWGFSSLKDTLDVVMVPIALALLAPWITRRWQDRQRDSETKTELVRDIVALVMKTIMPVHLYKTRSSQEPDSVDSQEKELAKVYKEWRIETCVIGSKLHAYFPDANLGEMQIHRRWHHFSERLNRYYEGRNMDNNVSSANAEAEREDLFEEKTSIVEDVLASPITGFRGKRTLPGS